MAHRREQTARITLAIAALPETYQLPLTLRLLEGCSYADVAAHTGQTAGAVRGQIGRGTRMLREKLRDMLD